MKEKEPEIEPRQLDSRSRDLKQPETSVPLPPCLLASLPRASHGPFQPELPTLPQGVKDLMGGHSWIVPPIATPHILFKA